MFGSSREWQHQVDTVRDGAGRLADSRSSREGVEKQVGCIAAHGRVKHTVMQRQMNDIFHSRTFPPRVCCSSFVVGGAVACSSDRKYRGVFRTFFLRQPPPSPTRRTPHGASRLVPANVCLVSEKLTFSVPAWQGCKGVWYGRTTAESCYGLREELHFSNPSIFH